MQQIGWLFGRAAANNFGKRFNMCMLSLNIWKMSVTFNPLVDLMLSIYTKNTITKSINSYKDKISFNLNLN